MRGTGQPFRVSPAEQASEAAATVSPPVRARAGIHGALRRMKAASPGIDTEIEAALKLYQEASVVPTHPELWPADATNTTSVGGTSTMYGTAKAGAMKYDAGSLSAGAVPFLTGGSVR